MSERDFFANRQIMEPSQTMAPKRAHSPIQLARQDRCAPGKWHLLKVIEDIREPLGLKGTSIAVLRALLSFVRSDDISPDQDATHICFASNMALSRRAHVSIQTVERHIAKLVSLGLLTRRSSGNGKRWARRDHTGQIVLATGLSLMPLVQRHAEFIELAQKHDARQREQALLRDKCALALAKLETACSDATAIADIKVHARRILRRRVDTAELKALYVDITAELPVDTPEESVKMRDSAPESEGHKETIQIQSVEEKKPDLKKVSADQMERAYPRLCTELRFEHSDQACQRRLQDIAMELRLGDLYSSLSALGPALRFMVLGYVLERIESIKSPRAYVQRLLDQLGTGALKQGSLLAKPNRRSSFGQAAKTVDHRTTRHSFEMAAL